MKIKSVKKVLVLMLVAVALTAVLCSCSLFNKNNKETTVVYLSLDGGSGVSSADFISKGTPKILVEPKKTPEKAGFEFLGWYLDEEYEEAVVFGEEITEDIHIYAKWKEKEIVATFVLGGNEKDMEIPAKKGKVTPPTVSREGYEFKGWFTDRELTLSADFETALTNDLTVFAKWEIIKYKINYNSEGKAEAPLGGKLSYTINDRIVLADPSNIAEGYEFLGWYNGSEKVTEIPRGSTGDITVTAKFVCGNKKIEKVLGGSVDGNFAKTVVKNSVSSIVFADYITVSDRATFVVRNAEGTEISSAELEVGDTEFTVEVTAENKEKASYKFTVTRFDGTRTYFYFRNLYGEERFIEVELGDYITPPADMESKKGYDFLGWFFDAEGKNAVDLETPVTEQIEDIYAVFSPIKYQIKYVTDWQLDEEAVTEFTVEDSVILPVPFTTDGSRYSFYGWKLEGDASEFITEINADTFYEDITLTAFYCVTPVEFLEGFEENATLTDENIISYLEWRVFLRETSTHVTVTVDGEFNENYWQTVADRLSDMEMGFATDLSFRNASATPKEGKTEYSFDFVATYVFPENVAGDKEVYGQIPYYLHGFDGAISHYIIDFVINTVEVTDSEQLYQAVVNGYAPVPTEGSSAERIATKARLVIEKIISPNMTDIEKAHAIYDWLVLNVYYDYDLFETSKTEDGASLKGYNGFYLEGVFDDGRAVCDGISKAFALLCNMVGIECVQVVGETVKGVGHAWNKFKIDGKWYNADPTAAGLLLTVSTEESVISKEGLTHRYFMLTDEQTALFNTPTDSKFGYENLVADTDYSFYSSQTFVYNEVEYDFVIATEEEWQIAVAYLKDFVTKGEQVVDFAVLDGENVQETIKSACATVGITATPVIFFDENTNTVIIWFMTVAEQN